MDFEDAKNKVNTFFNGLTTHNYFNTKILSKVEFVYKEVLKNIEDMTNDIEMVSDDTFNKNVINAMSQIRRTIFVSKITPIFSDFVLGYIEIIHSWNNNLSKNPEITELVFHSKRLLEQHLTITEASEQLKMLTTMVKNLSNWMPPAFEISKHYIDLLNEEGYPVKSEKIGG